MHSCSSSTAQIGITRRQRIAGYSITEFSQPPHRRLPWHEHTDASICFVVSGSYAEQTRGAARECPPQSMVFKPAAERHADQFGRDGGTCLLMEIGPSRLEAIESVSDVITRPSFVRTAKLATLGRQVYREFTRGDAFSPLAIEGLILEVLAEGSRAALAPSATQPPMWLRRAHDLIHDTFSEPLTLSSIARAVGVHPSHLARTFRKQYRGSIGEYVRRLRIERACRELAGTNAALSDIGLRSGFFDQSHFSRVFKQHTGLTPAEYRTAARGCTSHPTAHRAS